MIKPQHVYAYLLLITCLLSRQAHARDESNYLFRFYGGPVLAFYNNDPDYTINTKARASFTLGGRMEYLFNGYNSITVGAEYVTHALGFDSYFFNPGQLPVYDKTFPYHHNVRLHEVHVPLLAKFNFIKENDQPFNAYVLAGCSYRYIFSSYAIITSNINGAYAWTGNIHADMEYPLIVRSGSSLLVAGFGTERNFQPQRTAAYIELQYKFGLSRFRYEGSGTAREFFIKDSFLAVNIGYKF